MKKPSRSEIVESCEQTGGDYYFQITIWNRNGSPMVSTCGPMTKTFGKRLAAIQMEGMETRGGLRASKRPARKGKK